MSMPLKRYESTAVDWRTWQHVPLETVGQTAEALTSGLQGSVNVHRCALLLMPQ